MTYSELIARVADFTHRSDLAAQMPTFVELAEAKINRTLRVRQMEGAITGTIDAGNELALPADFLALKAIWPSGLESVRIHPQTVETVIASGRVSGTPSLYAVTDSALRFDGSGDVTGVYFKRIPSLATNGSNWLADAHPDVYLWSVLAESAAYTMDANQGAFFSTKAQEAMLSTQSADMRDRFSGQLTARKV